MKRLLGMLLLVGVVGCGPTQVETPSQAAPPPEVAAIKKNKSPAQLKLGEPVTNSIGMVLVPIPTGEFTMGFVMGFQKGHQVKITKPFHLGAFEVTQAQYEMAMGRNPSRFKGANNPVDQVSWNDAIEFCRELSALSEEKAAGRVYRLPTEAEWEYACRAGTKTAYSFGDDASQLGDYAWYKENSGGTTHPVGQKRPNPWGLYDIQGNLTEWCQPAARPLPGSYRPFRGGSLTDGASGCKSWGSDSHSTGERHFNIGFRVAQVPLAQL